MQEKITLSDIFDQYGENYITNNRVNGQEKGLIRLLSACRTDALGSHFERCDQCGYFGKSHNSCRNRHCPACQQKDKLAWLDKRMGELLPVGYYHLVFTIKEMKLDIDEFIRRFLLHVLPKRFLKVRYYGIFTNKCRKQNIETAKALLGQEAADKKEEAIQDGETVWEKQDTVWDQILACIKNYRRPNCPVCKKGYLHFAGTVPNINREPG